MNLIKVAVALMLCSVVAFAGPQKYRFQRLNFNDSLCSGICVSSLEVDYPLATQKDSVSKALRELVMYLLDQPEAYATDKDSLKKVFGAWDACGFKQKYASSCDAIKKNELEDYCFEDPTYFPATCHYEREIHLTYSHQTKYLVFYDYLKTSYDEGAAHGNTDGRWTVMYDKRTGSQITEEDIFKSYSDESLKKKLMDLAKLKYSPQDEKYIGLGEAYPENGYLMTGWNDCSCVATCNGDFEKKRIPLSKVKDLIRPEALIYFQK